MRMSVVFAAIMVSTAALAAEEPRKIDFTQAILDQDAQPFLECADNPPPKEERDCRSRRQITLGMVAFRALSQPEQNMSPEESFRRGALGLQLYKSAAASLTVEDLALIKRQIAKGFGPLIVATVFPLLDPASK